MDVVILNTSRLRVAISNYVKKNNEVSMAECLKRNNVNTSVLSKSETRFISAYKNKVSFKVDEYTLYGAVYSDVWERIKKIFGLKPEDFELERISVVSTYRCGDKSKLEARISDLEEKYIVLAKIVEELRKK